MRYQCILHIDDDEEDMELFEFALNKLPSAPVYKPMTNAKQALQLLKEKQLQPDVIFLDLNMPGMTGEQFLKQIKQAEELHTIHVIVFSTTSNPDTIQRTIELGAGEFYSKPVKFDDLVDTLQSILHS